MSILFFETSNIRFDQSVPDDDPSAQIITSAGETKNQLTLPSKDTLSNMFKSIKLNKSTPKIPSNLVKSHFGQYNNNHKQTSRDELINDKQQLIEYLNESEQCLTNARHDYENNYAAFLDLTKKFYKEKLKNLKLTFKNQILKQQIYFETELIELSKDYLKDFEHLAPNTPSRKTGKHDKEKHVIKLFRNEMKKLIDYMKESLINSSDTLIEAFETCEILKRIDHTESQVCKQYLYFAKPASTNSSPVEQQLTEEQIEINKYKADMDDLMHILDDIELQHLERKNLLTTKTKFVSKLKSKYKFIEQKFQNLNRQISNLKFESFVYKQLWTEKQRSNEHMLERTRTLMNESSSSSSRTCSTSSLSDSDECSNQNSTCSSSSINCNQDNSDLDDDLEELDQEPCLSTQDYNRKLSIINNLIDLHKAKLNHKDLCYSRSNHLNRLTSNDQKIQVIKCENEQETELTDHVMSRLKRRENSSLDLSDCSTDGDRVIVENCSLKLDRDISNWFITRQIENMSVFKYRLPNGSIIKSGKELRIHTPFQNSQIDFLVAIKQRLNLPTTQINNNRLCLKIRTKLVSPEGIVKAVHIQEIPQFYQEIFKYASLIQFL